jgi:AcrR family transcriptional regulator
MPRPFDPDLADRIVRVTADMLEERGIEGVTMRGVAQAAGCSATTIYQRFDGKDELLHHAVVKGLQWFGESSARATAGASGPALLAANSRAYVEWGIANPAMYRLMFEQRLPVPAEGDELQRRRSGWEQQREMLAGILASRPAGAVEVDAGIATDTVFVALHGIVSLAISGRLIGPMATAEQNLERAEVVVSALLDQWAGAWGLAG